ncbi:Protein of unknown function [Gryllus bimaculatus]|nr:Protein of unknown function [Gryllus bimaculatus]
MGGEAERGQGHQRGDERAVEEGGIGGAADILGGPCPSVEVPDALRTTTLTAASGRVACIQSLPHATLWCVAGAKSAAGRRQEP